MMMGGMSGFWLISLLWLSVLCGFAYILVVLANKEAKNLKTIGQVIALVIVVLAVILSVGSIYAGNRMAAKYSKGQGMMDKGMMMQNQDMQKMMQQKMK